MKTYTIDTIANMIVKYENDFNGCLKIGYKDNNTFLQDVKSEIENGVNEILPYYRRDLIERNNTNSTHEQREELKAIILILEGQTN